MQKQKLYVRPIVVGCYGKDGCPLPTSNAEIRESKARIEKSKKAQLVR
ncbi:hypothetical protein L6255_00265 [Candidatus Parcubacteria bacterium]|nr:hypothetical protein [Patescibacteria group bacterium]MCG2688874.1 hypothetical protein [Candidatus Parcubacteria bacterium]